MILHLSTQTSQLDISNMVRELSSVTVLSLTMKMEHLIKKSSETLLTMKQRMVIHQKATILAQVPQLQEQPLILTTQEDHGLINSALNTGSFKLQVTCIQ